MMSTQAHTGMTTSRRSLTLPAGRTRLAALLKLVVERVTGYPALRLSLRRPLPDGGLAFRGIEPTRQLADAGLGRTHLRHRRGFSHQGKRALRRPLARPAFSSRQHVSAVLSCG